MKYDLVLLTVYFSIFMQFATSIVQLDGIFIKLPEEHAILTDILKRSLTKKILSRLTDLQTILLILIGRRCIPSLQKSSPIFTL